jgi:hypothetical protein
MDDTIDRIKSELEEAKQSLQQTVTEVNRKVERNVETVANFRPGHLVQSHPLVSVCVAGALGFIWGNRNTGPGAVLVMGGLLSMVLSEVWNDGFTDHDTASR